MLPQINHKYFLITVFLSVRLSWVLFSPILILFESIENLYSIFKIFVYTSNDLYDIQKLFLIFYNL